MKNLVSDPYLKGDRPVYFCNFYGFDGIRRTPSLGTRVHIEAKQICLDLDTILSSAENQSADPHSYSFAHLKPRAVRLAFGLQEDPTPRPANIEVSSNQITTIANIAAQLPELRHLAGNAGSTLRIKIESDELNDALLRVRSLEIENQLLQEQLDEATKEIRSLKKAYNVEVTTNYREALEDFKAYKSLKVKKSTLRDTMRVNTALALNCGSKPLPEVSPAEIDSFIANIEGSNDTKRKARAYVSTFWTWAQKQFSLSHNPMDLTDSAGKSSEKEIQCIKDEDLLRRYLEAHRTEPYWHAWVTFACLTGCSWQDTALMEWRNIDKDLLEISVVRNKTGVFRRTPIESTYLKPTLKDYLENHLDKEQPYLFPTPWGRHWEASVWHSYYRKDSKCKKPRKSVVERLQKDGDMLPWNYGPDEWRHQGATTMGHCGFSSLQISQWIGNSETICRKHYIAHIAAKRWTFRYE